MYVNKSYLTYQFQLATYTQMVTKFFVILKFIYNDIRGHM